MIQKDPFAAGFCEKSCGAVPEELQEILNAIPGGAACYRIAENRLEPVFYSDSLPALFGYARQRFHALTKGDALRLVYKADLARVCGAIEAAVASGQALDVSCRAQHGDGRLTWVHLGGRRAGSASIGLRFYVVFSGISAEARQFQRLANETAHGIYVIERESYELLYVNESKNLFIGSSDHVGEKCYTALHGRQEPCEFCTLKTHPADGTVHGMHAGNNGHFYSTRFQETLWLGIPAYIKYVQDVTEEVKAQQEKERLDQYFQTLVHKLPGGIAVVRFEKGGGRIPEYFSDGFAALCGMTMAEVWQLYQEDGMAGVHPADLDQLNKELDAFIASGKDHCELTYRLKKGDGSYLWVKNNVSMLQRGNGEFTFYANYRDITKERKEQETIRRQYKELILQHYRTPGPNALIVGHCNITQNRILEISDQTHSNLLKTFGTEREHFFTGLAGLVVNGAERQAFLNVFLNKPALAAFAAGDTEQQLNCFIRLPQETAGRYANFKMILVETPDTGDITGILTVSDITEETISSRNLHQLSTYNYDLIADVDLPRDSSTLLSGSLRPGDADQRTGCHSERLAWMIREQVVPKDKDLVAKMTAPAYMLEHLERGGAYSFSFSTLGGSGEIQTKKMTVSAADLQLGRICLAMADITDSVREQQGMLSAMAYTFELLGFIHIRSQSFTLYTRRTVLEALQPDQCEYPAWLESLKKKYAPQGGPQEVEHRFGLASILKQLREQPNGYDFVMPYRDGDGLCYKQVNVLWGDQGHNTVCLVRQDVTDMLTAERQSKQALEKALALAEEANQAKSDFLSSMSHDIRTPLNGIMGMTALAEAHLADRDKVQGCLQKIALSSRHLLSLINDILDMSKIERSKIALNHTNVLLPDLLEQLSSMMGPQAREVGLCFELRTAEIKHECFCGDPLRISQILLNLLSNAIKFTPEGGSVSFEVEELAPIKGAEYVRYRFTVRDTGVGMSQDFMAHLFEPFTRSEKTARIQGTGLGLSITKGLIDLMEGSISVESEEQRGSTFRVELECELAEQAHVRTVQPQTPGTGRAGERRVAGRRFLVAEDNEINAEILSELMQLHGAETVVKPNGAQTVRAFEISAPGTYDAILMDIQMPEMNGYEAARAIRGLAREDAARIPIIAMTANAFAEDIREALNAGMNAHIAKPIDMQVLLEALNHWMQ